MAALEASHQSADRHCGALHLGQTNPNRLILRIEWSRWVVPAALSNSDTQGGRAGMPRRRSAPEARYVNVREQQISKFGILQML
jgi:hypothetical protein